MGFKDVFGKIIGIESDDYEEEITQEEIDAERRKIEMESGHSASENKAFGNISPSLDLKLDSAYEGISPMISQGSQAAPEKSYSMNGSQTFKMLVIEPKTFEECTKLVDNLKARKPVIINLEKVETDLARKIFDFMSGATYALNGNMQKVTANIFIFAPANVEMAAKLNRETVAGTQTTSSNKSPWK